jgi:PAS domain S-box-containing protein
VTDWHHLLRRQIERHLGERPVAPEVRELLGDVNRAYVDRELLARSLDVTSQELVRRNEELRATLSASGVGTWSWNEAADEAVWEGYPHPLSSTENGRTVGRLAQLVALIDAEDRDLFLEEVHAALTRGDGAEVCVRAGEGWVVLRGRVTLTPSGPVLGGICLDVTAQVRQERAEVDRRHRLEQQGRVALGLASAMADPNVELGQLVRGTTEAVATALPCAHVGVWLFDEVGVDLACLDEYAVATGQHGAGALLARRQHPVWFAALEEEGGIAAGSVEADPTTHELSAWLGPLGVTAQLAVPVRSGGRLVGVVCCGHVGGERAWSSEERTFASSIGDLVGMMLETQRRRQAEEELEQQRGSLRQILDINPNLIFAKDRAGRFVLANQSLAELYGTTPEALLGKTDADFNANADEVEAFRKRDLEVIDENLEIFIAEEKVTGSRGQVRWLQTVKRPLVGLNRENLLLGVATDITERKRAEDERRNLEARLRQAEKLQSIGLLAGGVAHDFNNLLTPVLMAAESLYEQLPDGELADDAAEILGAARRAAELTAQLLAFGRQQVLQVKPLRLDDETRRSLRLLRRLLPESIELRTELAAEVRSVLADPTQIQQVLINLAVNARDAMLAGGTITIRTSREIVGNTAWVVWSVTDTGTGMDAETVSHIFEPFFTTKELGRGTGLGLATVYGIVNQHGGTIQVESDVGKGSRFTVRLPEIPDVTPDPVFLPEQVGGAETVLLVDDDMMVCQVVERALKKAGYHVMVAGHPDDALRNLGDYQGPLDLVLTDVVLPHMNGRELYSRIAHAHPEARVLYMSGHPQDILAPQGVLGPETRFLPKPFTAAGLIGAVRDALDNET